MALTKEKIRTILTRRLALDDPQFYLEKVGDRIVGDIVSPSFRGKRDHERQNLIWDVLEEEWGAEADRSVGMLLAYTPQEWELGQVDKPVPKKKKKAG